MGKKNLLKVKKKKDGWFFTRSLLEEIHELEVEEDLEKLPIVASALGPKKRENQKKDEPFEKESKKNSAVVSAESMVSEATFKALQQKYEQATTQLVSFKEQEMRYRQLEVEYKKLQAESEEEPRVSTSTMVAFQQETKEQLLQLQEDNEALSQVIEANDALSSAEITRYRQELLDMTLAQESLLSEKQVLEEQLATIRQELSEKVTTAYIASERVLSLETDIQQLIDHKEQVDALEKQLVEETGKVNEERNQRVQLERQLIQIETSYQEEREQWTYQQEEATHQAYDNHLLIETLQEQIHKQNQQLTENQAEVQQLTDLTKQQAISIAAQHSSNLSKDEENHQLRDRLASLEEQAAIAEQQIEETMEENDLLAQALKKLLASNEVLQNALEVQGLPKKTEDKYLTEAEKTISSLEAELQAMTEENKMLKEENHLKDQQTGDLMLEAQNQANQLLVEAQEMVQQKIQAAELALTVINTGAQKIFLEVDASRTHISSIYGDLETIFHQVVKGETRFDTDDGLISIH